MGEIGGTWSRAHGTVHRVRHRSHTHQPAAEPQHSNQPWRKSLSDASAATADFNFAIVSCRPSMCSAIAINLSNSEYALRNGCAPSIASAIWCASVGMSDMLIAHE